jgi:hypothetical protein
MALQAVPDYGINIPDAGKAFEEGMMFRQQQQAQLAQRAEAEELKKAIGSLGPNPSVQSINALIVKYPALAERFKKPLEILSDEERQVKQGQAVPIYAAMQNGKPEVAKALLRQQADALRNSGNEKGAKETEAQIQLIDLDPGSAATTFGVVLSGIMGPDNFQKTFGELREQQLLPGRIKELDAKARQDAANAGFQVFKSEILGNGTAVMVSRDGTTRVQDVTGKILTGADARLAIEMAREAETRYQRNIAGAEAGAKAGVEAETRPAIERSVEEAKQAVTVAKEASAGLAKATNSIANLRRALELSNGGANTGVIARAFPTIKAASVELANLRNNLGLDVVAGGSFGALSESELSLALDTGLPTGLDEKELAKWLERKIAAQESVRQAFAAKARHFARGGTTAEWLDKFESGATPAPAGVAPANDMAAAAAAELARRRGGG